MANDPEKAGSGLRSRAIGAILSASMFLGGCASSEQPVVLVDSVSPTAVVPVSPVAVPDSKQTDTPTDTTADPAAVVPATTTEGSGTTSRPGEIAPPGDPAATGSLDASSDGLGEARFGDDAQDAIGYFAQQFGPPTSDSGWAPNQSPCDGLGTRQRTLSWNDLAVVVLTTGPTETIQRAADHFSAFMVFREFPGADRITVEGSTVLGRSVSDLRAEIPGVTSFESEIEGSLWAVGSDGLGGVSGSVLDGVTTSVRAGLFCID